MRWKSNSTILPETGEWVNLRPIPNSPIRLERQTPEAFREITQRDGARRRILASLTSGASAVQHRPDTRSGGIDTFVRGYIRELPGARVQENR